MRFSLLLLVLFTLLTACSPGAEAQTDSSMKDDTRTTVIYLTRHAEKDDSAGDNPPLLPAGESRARNLAERLSVEGITAIYATDFRRTQATARPLADVLSLPVTGYAADGNAKDLTDDWRRRYAGQSILVVGHSNTIPSLVNELLGSNEYNDLSEGEYSMLYRVTIAAEGKATVEELRTSN